MNRLKKIFKNFKGPKLFDAIFLIILVIVYSVLTFFNLGDFDAPQTFYRLGSEERLVIFLPEETKVKDMKFYVGISKNDFQLSYSTLENSDFCTCNLNQEYSYVGDLETSKETEIAVDGPFRWRETNINKTVSNLVIHNTSGRDIDFGEIMLFDGNDQKIEPLEFREIEYDMIRNNGETVALTDEQDLLPEEFNYHNSSYFDELYFAQTAYQYATNQEGYEEVHPPLGKILQSLPIKITGKMAPFTWRFAGAFAGVLIIIVLYFFAKELFGNSSYGRLAGVLVSLSGLHFVQTRVGTIDSHLYLFTLLTFLNMLKFLRSDKIRYFALSGFFFGCCFAVKWSGAFAGIGLSIMFFYWFYQKYLKKSSKTWKKKLLNLTNLKWFGLGISCFILVPAIIYFGVYLLFPETTKATSAQDVIDQGAYLFSYHSSERTPHPYSSPWFTWPVSLKPMLYEYSDGVSIWLYGNYVLSYISVIALLISTYFALKYRSKTALFILIAFLSLWLPYAFIERPMFLYHYLPASGFAILAILEMFYELPKIRKVIPFLLLTILLTFIISYPKYAGI